MLTLMHGPVHLSFIIVLHINTNIIIYINGFIFTITFFLDII